MAVPNGAGGHPEGRSTVLTDLIVWAHRYGSGEPLPSAADIQSALADYTADLEENQAQALVAVVSGARQLAELLARSAEGVEVRAAQLARTSTPRATVRELAAATGLSERNASDRYRLPPDLSPSI